jgi:hypothetical protein
VNIYGTRNPVKLIWRAFLTWLWRRELRKMNRVDRTVQEKK